MKTHLVIVVDITEITLHGYEWLTYQLYSEQEKTLRDRNRFSLQFKVRAGVQEDYAGCAVRISVSILSS